MTRAQKLDRLMDVFEILRSVDPLMPMQIAHIFVAVSLRPRLTMGELGQLVNLSQSSCSRNIMTLGRGTPRERNGHRLVAVDNDPNDGRRFIIRPTEKGRRLAQEIVQAMEAG